MPFIGTVRLPWGGAPAWHAERRAAWKARILELALDHEELGRARELASEYLRNYGPAIGWFHRRCINYGSAWKSLVYPLFGFRR